MGRSISLPPHHAATLDRGGPVASSGIRADHRPGTPALRAVPTADGCCRFGYPGAQARRCEHPQAPRGPQDPADQVVGVLAVKLDDDAALRRDLALECG